MYDINEPDNSIESMPQSIPDLIQRIPSINEPTSPTVITQENDPITPNVQNNEVINNDATDSGKVGDVVVATDSNKEVDYDTYFVQPEKFENIDQEIAWYRERFETLSKELNPSSELIKEFAQPHVDEYIKQQEQEIQGFAEMKRALDVNPRAFLMQYIPEALAELGISPIMSDNEIMENILKDMQKQFGEDYKERFDNRDVIDPRTESAQMWLQMEKLKSEYINLNNRNTEILNKWNSNVISKEVQAPSNEDQMRFIESSYKEQFEPLEIPKEEFNATIEWAKQAPPITTLDVYKLKNFDSLLKEAYNSGMIEGKQTNYKNTLNRGGQEVVVNGTPEKTNVNETDNTAYLINQMQYGGIPAF